MITNTETFHDKISLIVDLQESNVFHISKQGYRKKIKRLDSACENKLDSPCFAYPNICYLDVFYLNGKKILIEAFQLRAELVLEYANKILYF